MLFCREKPCSPAGNSTYIMMNVKHINVTKSLLNCSGDQRSPIEPIAKSVRLNTNHLLYEIYVCKYLQNWFACFGCTTKTNGEHGSPLQFTHNIHYIKIFLYNKPIYQGGRPMNAPTDLWHLLNFQIHCLLLQMIKIENSENILVFVTQLSILVWYNKVTT